MPILVFLGLSVLDLGPMYATDKRQTSDAHHRLMGRGHNNILIDISIITRLRITGLPSQRFWVGSGRVGSRVYTSDPVSTLNETYITMPPPLGGALSDDAV